MQVQRLTAYARLDDASELLTYAKAEADAGDDSWAQWMSEFEQGKAVVVRLELTIEVANGANERLHASTRSFFIESAASTPDVQRQIAEVAHDHLLTVAQEGRTAPSGEPGAFEFEENEPRTLEFDKLRIHVELGPALRRCLGTRRDQAQS